MAINSLTTEITLNYPHSKVVMEGLVHDCKHKINGAVSFIISKSLFQPGTWWQCF